MGTGSNTATAAYNPANEPWRNGNTDTYLVNLASNPANEPWRNGMTDFSLMNLDNNPANDPWRNGMTDTYLQNLGFLKDLEARRDFTKYLIGGLQNLDANPANEPWRNGMTDTYLVNLASDPANEPWRNGHTDTYLMNLDNNPANDPWRNGMTDTYLVNLASDPALEPWRNGNTDTYLMNLGFLGDLEKRRDFTKAFIEGRYLQNLGGIPSGTAKGKSLASKSSSIAKSRNTVGKCYAAVADAIDATVARFLYGNSAYQAADQLAKRSEFKEIKGLKGSDLPKLPAGAVVVWRKTSASPHGHISVALGGGKEASDHVANQMTSLRGDSGFRVFMPK